MLSNGSTAHQKLDELFPVPSFPPSLLSPQRLPGANMDSLAALQEVLRDNHQRYHIFFNDSHFHNYVTHRALAIYALGGPAATIRDYYRRDARIQRPIIKSPEPITEENFFDHLGDEKFYQAYIAFFSDQVSEKGVADTLEEFLFSEQYNFRKGGDTNTQPEMLTRLFQPLAHALIHVGYGVEFGLKGVLVEGLALAAVHSVRVRGYLSPSLFVPSSTKVGANIEHSPSSFTSDGPATNDYPTPNAGGVHAFDIMARILKDDKLKSRGTPADLISQYVELLAEYSSVVKEHAEQWSVDLGQPGEVERKMEELIWLSSLAYGVGGLTPNGFQSDFFLMHAVTASLFLPSLIAYLSPRSQVLLLRGYLITALTWWVMRGRPALNIRSFMTTTSVEPSVHSIPPSRRPPSMETIPTPNPFLTILQSAIAHPRNHVVKIQRAFAHFDTLYGRRPAGYFKGTELEDAEVLDGSLFLRASLLTADYVGWVREGKKPRHFSLRGFYV